MKKLIELDAALDALADYIHNVDRVYSTGKLTHEDCMDAAHSILDELPSAQPVAKDINVPVKDCISRQAAIDELEERLRANGYTNVALVSELNRCIGYIMRLPFAQPEIVENLYLYKCFITDKDGLQHEVIHTGDIRRVTGWEI